jgi:hypothetical protein
MQYVAYINVKTNDAYKIITDRLAHMLRIVEVPSLILGFETGRCRYTALN